MTYTGQTPMNDLLTGMTTIGADACHEFVQCQYQAGYGENLASYLQQSSRQLRHIHGPHADPQRSLL